MTAFVVDTRTGEKTEFDSVNEAVDHIGEVLTEVDPEGVFAGTYQIDDMDDPDAERT